MNLSGPAVVSAWKAFLHGLPNADRPRARLVVVHDELENPIGKTRVRYGGSARGHNGIKSVTSSLGGMQYTKIGVGIGRPDSRESSVVANYVMKRMSPVEIQKISDGADGVMLDLIKMRNGEGSV